MAEAIPQTIDASVRAAEAAARPNVTAVVVMCAALLGIAFLVYRTEARTDAQIALLQKMADAYGKLASEQTELRRDFENAGIRVRRTVQAVDHE